MLFTSIRDIVKCSVWNIAYAAKVSQLYEQGEAARRIETDVQHWERWGRAVLVGCRQIVGVGPIRLVAAIRTAWQCASSVRVVLRTIK